jgi:photosystem II stability/assembly factor-like uncharacterized protein
MKKKLLLVFMSFITTFSFLQLHSQVNEGWVEVGNAAYNSQLYDIAFPTATKGFAIGSGGAFLKTTDGGATWTAHDIGAKYTLFQIHFTSATTGYIMGGIRIGPLMSKVLKTTDGGQTWNEIYSLNSDYLTDMFFLNDTHGWLSSNEKITYTTDGGQNWTTVAQSGSFTIKNVLFTNATRGLYLDNNSKVRKSTDGGQTWSIFSDLALNGKTINFADPENGFMLTVMSQALFSSVDSGATWVAKNSPGDICEVIRAETDSIVYLLNYDENKIFRTADAGTTFQTVYQQNGAGLKNFRKFHGKYYAVGAGGLIIESVDGFVWNTIHQGNYSGLLTDVTFIDDTYGIAVGTKGFIKKTTNGGVSWQVESLHPYKDLKGVSYFNTDNILIAGSDSLLLRSTDTCQTWTSTATGFSTQNAYGITMTSPLTGFAFGNLPLLKTTDGGATWAQSGTYGNVHSCSAVNIDTIFFGMNNNFGYTLDGGTSYVTPIATTNIQRALHFFNGDEGVRVSHWGHIFITTDRGANWTRSINLSNDMFDITFIDDTTGYCVGDNGYIYKSIDRGISWFQIESPTMRSLHAVWFTPDGTGYIVGNDGVILRKAIVPTYTVDFEVSNVEGQIISDATMTFDGSAYPVGQYTVIGLEAETYPYSFSASGHETYNDNLILSSDTTITIVMQNYHEVSVSVENIFNNPVSSADVSLGLMSDQTDASGTVIFQNVTKANEIQLQVSATNYIDKTISVDIMGDTLFAFVLEADLDAPVANVAENIEGNSFEANWTAVANADSYALFVSQDSFITHIAGFDSLVVTGTTRLVDGLAPNQQYSYRLRAINAYGISDYSNVITETATDHTGLENFQKENIFIHPNPAEDILYIGNVNPAVNQMAYINDIAGRNLMIVNPSESNEIDISVLPEGIYIIRYMDKSVRFVKM